VWSGLRDEWMLYLGQNVSILQGPGEFSEKFEISALNEVLSKVGTFAHSKRKGILRPGLKVWLSGFFARPFQLGPIQGLRGWTEAQTLAQAAAPIATGLDGECAVYLDSWPGNTYTRAVAMEFKVLEPLVLVTAQYKLKLRSVRPTWSLAINRYGAEIQDGGVLAIIEEGVVSVVSDNQLANDVVGTYLGPTDDVSVAQYLRRSLLSAGLNYDACHVAKAGASESGGALSEFTFVPLDKLTR
jgi:hypothetical protein